MFGDRSQTLIGGADAKHFYRENPLRPQKFQGPLAMILWVNPIEKYVNSVFTRKFVVFFSRPLTRVNNFKGPLLYQTS